MKIFQVSGNLCHADFSKWGRIDDIPDGTFPQDLLDSLVEAPDYVFVGWGYHDGEFIKPETPKGFEYDEETGTFYPVDSNILANLQQNKWGKTYEAVVFGSITPEVFKAITGEDFIPEEDILEETT